MNAGQSARQLKSTVAPSGFVTMIVIVAAVLAVAIGAVALNAFRNQSPATPVGIHSSAADVQKALIQQRADEKANTSAGTSAGVSADNAQRALSQQRAAEKANTSAGVSADSAQKALSQQRAAEKAIDDSSWANQLRAEDRQFTFPDTTPARHLPPRPQ